MINIWMSLQENFLHDEVKKQYQQKDGYFKLP